MKGNRGLTFFVALGIALALLMARTHRVSAQGGCPQPSYTNEVFPWAKGTTVNFSFDWSGLGVQDNSNPNPVPKFQLNSTEMQWLSGGIQQWNNSKQTDSTNVTFNNSSTGTFPWIVSVAWPKAKVTYTASNGQAYTYPVDATPAPGSPAPAASTFYLPDRNAAGQTTGTASERVWLVGNDDVFTISTWCA
jgi:hypothetical protein